MFEPRMHMLSGQLKFWCTTGCSFLLLGFLEVAVSSLGHLLATQITPPVPAIKTLPVVHNTQTHYSNPSLLLLGDPWWEREKDKKRKGKHKCHKESCLKSQVLLSLPYDRQNFKGRDYVYMEFQNHCWHQIDSYTGIYSKQNRGCWNQVDF